MVGLFTQRDKVFMKVTNHGNSDMVRDLGVAVPTYMLYGLTIYA